MSTRLVGQEMTSLWTRQRGADWPTFLGPRSDNSSTETGILTKWPADGPRIVWQRELGEGYGIGSTSRGRFYQADRLGNLARLSCLHAETGQLLWKFEYPTSYVDMYGYDGGPRCSPVIEDDRVYLFGVEGMLHCLDAASGEPRWKCNTARRFGVVQNFFGVGSTPILCGDLLICIVGGSPEQDQSLPRGQLDRVTPNGSAIVAFDKMTGQVRYKTGNDLAGYAAPILARIGQRQWCFAFCRQGLLAFEPERGTIDFHLPWRSKKLESVNASTPVVVGNEVFISETYGPGSCLLRVSPGQYDIVWQDQLRRREKAMQAHWNTPIYHQGHLYGCSGRNPPDAELRCVEWKTGQVKWSEYTGRRSSLLYVDGHFVCLDERGKLQLIKANPKRLEVVAETVLSDGSGRSLLRYPCWAAPILSHGLLYVRGRERLVCLELIPERG
jgi:outer membrane protein assembly factor BamB